MTIDDPAFQTIAPTRGWAARRLAHLATSFALILVLAPSILSAQVPPRFYWKTLEGTNAVPLIYLSMNGNANPLDPANVIGAEIDAEVMIVGYARIFSLGNRAAMLALLQTTGRAGATLLVGGLGVSENATGFGDPMVEFTLNLIGPPTIKNIPDMLRYEPGFSLDLLVDLAFPVGEYDAESAVNLGQNRWYGRLAAPIVWQLGAWVPGRRTTLEFLPSVWLYGDNDNFGGSTLQTDPKFQLETHFTRDLTETFWASLDANYQSGGKSTSDGLSGESVDNLGVGFTLGYQLSDSLQLTIGYIASVNDSAPDDLRMDGIKVSLVYGWHKLIEGMGRLGSE